LLGLNPAAAPDIFAPGNRFAVGLGQYAREVATLESPVYSTSEEPYSPYICSGGNFDWTTVESILRPHDAVETEVDKIIASIEQTVLLEEEEEPAPSPVVASQISELIRQARGLMRSPMPEGTVSTFYGEINVTWRKGNSIVRIACFPNRQPILQFGNLSQPLGSYQSRPNPPTQDLASKLDALNQES